MLEPSYVVRIKTQGLVKDKSGGKAVSYRVGYRSYDVKVDNKLLRRNRVNLKPDKQRKRTNCSPCSKGCKQQFHKTVPKDYRYS